MNKIDLTRALIESLFKALGKGGDDIKPQLAHDGRMRRAYEALAKSDALEPLYKLIKTTNMSRSGFKESDFHYVGLKPPEPMPTFPELFDTLFAPRLTNRDLGFRCIFETLQKLAIKRPLIIETGCLRVPTNWSGDGQSTFLWDIFARDFDADVFSIDINEQSIAAARRACSNRVNLICNDSVFALSTLASLFEGRQCNLLYLDSFDLDLKDPLPSAIHHSLELTAARPLLRSGSIVAVDDYRVAGEVGGKGRIVDQFMQAVDAKILHDGYQKVWLLR